MKKGFTLIELLVVIAIIGVLAAFLMANFVGIRQRARDGQRKANLRQIQAALELYRADKGSYPTGNPFTCNGSFTDGGTSAITYMAKIPCDPLGGNNNYSYSLTGGNYKLIACLENGNDADKDSSTETFCNTTTRISYTLQNP